MQKLTTCAMKCGQSTPNSLAVSPIIPANIMWFINASQKGRGAALLRVLLWRGNRRPGFRCQEDREEHDAFGKGDGQDRLDQNLRRRAGIASHGFRSLRADET